MAHPVIDADECICCGVCVDTCPTDTLELGDECAVVANEDNCIACGQCMEACPTGAITEIVEDEPSRRHPAPPDAPGRPAHPGAFLVGDPAGGPLTNCQICILTARQTES